jgi:hypothetical protein
MNTLPRVEINNNNEAYLARTVVAMQLTGGDAESLGNRAVFSKMLAHTFRKPEVTF